MVHCMLTIDVPPRGPSILNAWLPVGWARIVALNVPLAGAEWDLDGTPRARRRKVVVPIAVVV